MDSNYHIQIVKPLRLIWFSSKNIQKQVVQCSIENEKMIDQIWISAERQWKCNILGKEPEKLLILMSSLIILGTHILTWFYMYGGDN
jgi:hypothetical protein